MTEEIIISIIEDFINIINKKMVKLSNKIAPLEKRLEELSDLNNKFKLLIENLKAEQNSEDYNYDFDGGNVSHVS